MPTFRLPQASFNASSVVTGTSSAPSISVAPPAVPTQPPSPNYRGYGIVRSLSAQVACGATAQAAMAVTLTDNSSYAGTNTLFVGSIAAPADGVGFISPNGLALPFYGTLALVVSGTGAATATQVSINISGEYINYGDY